VCAGGNGRRRDRARRARSRARGVLPGLSSTGSPPS
jgi:hypothetical protein